MSTSATLPLAVYIFNNLGTVLVKHVVQKSEKIPKPAQLGTVLTAMASFGNNPSCLKLKLGEYTAVCSIDSVAMVVAIGRLGADEKPLGEIAGRVRQLLSSLHGEYITEFTTAEKEQRDKFLAEYRATDIEKIASGTHDTLPALVGFQMEYMKHLVRTPSDYVEEMEAMIELPGVLGAILVDSDDHSTVAPKTDPLRTANSPACFVGPSHPAIWQTICLYSDVLTQASSRVYSANLRTPSSPARVAVNSADSASKTMAVMRFHELRPPLDICICPVPETRKSIVVYYQGGEMGTQDHTFDMSAAMDTVPPELLTAEMHRKMYFSSSYTVHNHAIVVRKVRMAIGEAAIRLSAVVQQDSSLVPPPEDCPPSPIRGPGSIPSLSPLRMVHTPTHSSIAHPVESTHQFSSPMYEKQSRQPRAILTDEDDQSSPRAAIPKKRPVPPVFRAPVPPDMPRPSAPRPLRDSILASS